MKKQWKKFLKENESNWSYGIVPALVGRLAAALEKGDSVAAQDAKGGLAEQGIIITSSGNLAFLVDLVGKDIFKK